MYAESLILLSGIVVWSPNSLSSPEFHKSITHIGLPVPKTPIRSPRANNLCERVIEEKVDRFMVFIRNRQAKATRRAMI